ncbi:hypothetical protein Z949_692 [Sulfitobacter guttiformis KCTC 32187]|uniref:Uncharacterized protein n=1 Tax=Sulfitobacter guttiformis TaxID=74349 RepID=A0A420DK66_9RHOB|nr:hypothetical protein Z949_692 [Sulfitobacter guttiformis KCTC 32187]RKE94630.1 hypothetical protein C8N30_3761 [Sulfitobacter guttiformis]
MGMAHTTWGAVVGTPYCRNPAKKGLFLRVAMQRYLQPPDYGLKLGEEIGVKKGGVTLRSGGDLRFQAALLVKLILCKDD